MQRGLALLRAIHSRAWGHAERLAVEAVEAEAEAAKAEKGGQVEEVKEVKEAKEAEAVKQAEEAKAGGMAAEEGGEATDKAPSPRVLSCPEPAATPEAPAAGWAAVVSYVQYARRQSEQHLPLWQRTCPAGVAARLEPFDRKLEAEGVRPAAAAAFRASYTQLVTLHAAAADRAEPQAGCLASTTPANPAADPGDPANNAANPAHSGDPAARWLRCTVPDTALASVGALPRLERSPLPL